MLEEGKELEGGAKLSDRKQENHPFIQQMFTEPQPYPRHSLDIWDIMSNSPPLWSLYSSGGKI